MDLAVALTAMRIDEPKARGVSLADLRELVAEADRRGLTGDAMINPQTDAGGRIVALWIAGGRAPKAALTCAGGA